MDKIGTCPSLVFLPFPLGVGGSVRKVVSRSKFTEHIFMLQAEQNFQICAQIILLLQVAEQFM